MRARAIVTSFSIVRRGAFTRAPDDCIMHRTGFVALLALGPVQTLREADLVTIAMRWP
jgi:hypothetical protein